MKNLDPEEVAQLLQIIQKKPAQRIVHFCEKESILNQSVASLCKEYNNVCMAGGIDIDSFLFIGISKRENT